MVPPVTLMALREGLLPSGTNCDCRPRILTQKLVRPRPPQLRSTTRPKTLFWMAGSAHRAALGEKMGANERFQRHLRKKMKPSARSAGATF